MILKRSKSLVQSFILVIIFFFFLIFFYSNEHIFYIIFRIFSGLSFLFFKCPFFFVFVSFMFLLFVLFVIYIYIFFFTFFQFSDFSFIHFYFLYSVLTFFTLRLVRTFLFFSLCSNGIPSGALSNKHTAPRIRVHALIWIRAPESACTRLRTRVIRSFFSTRLLHIIGFTLDCLLGGGIFLGGFICGRINCMRGGAANRERTESRGMRPIINADSFFLCIWPNSLKRYPFTERQKKKRM